MPSLPPRSPRPPPAPPLPTATPTNTPPEKSSTGMATTIVAGTAMVAAVAALTSTAVGDSDRSTAPWTPAMFLCLAAGLLLSKFARTLPVVLAMTMQVVISYAIHLSRTLAEEEDGEEAEKAGGGCLGLGWEGVRGRVAVQEWESKRRKNRRNEQDREAQEKSDGGQARQPIREQKHSQEQQQQGRDEAVGRTQRRVTVEWEGGQMFVVLRRPIVSKWVINLVNR